MFLSPATFLVLYVTVGVILTLYWNMDNDGLINATMIFGWWLWPFFIAYFFLDDLYYYKIKHKCSVCGEKKEIGNFYADGRKVCFDCSDGEKGVSE